MSYSGNVVTDLPDWTPPTDIISEPPSTKKGEGWQVEEYPPAQWRNWFDEGFYQSIKELDIEIGNIQDGTTTVAEASNSDTVDGEHADELVRVDGTRAMTSDFDVGSNDIINVTNIGGAEISKISNLLQEYYNVKDYGIVGDGTTDDTTAMQSLIDQIKTNGGGTLYIPHDMVVAFSDTLDFTEIENFRLTGNGKLKYIGSTSIDKLDFSGAIKNVIIDGIELEGNVQNIGMDDTASGSQGIRIGRSTEGIPQNVTIRDCYIHDIGKNGDGIYIRGLPNETFDASIHINNIDIYNNTIETVSRNGISVTSGAKIHIHNNTIFGPDRWSIDLEGSGTTDRNIYDVKVNDNICDGSSKSDASIYNDSVSGDHSGIACFTWDFCENVSITNNVVKNHGKETGGPDDFHYGEYGIASVYPNVQVSGNYIENCIKGVYLHADNFNGLANKNQINSLTTNTVELIANGTTKTTHFVSRNYYEGNANGWEPIYRFKTTGSFANMGIKGNLELNMNKITTDDSYHENGAIYINTDTASFGSEGDTYSISTHARIVVTADTEIAELEVDIDMNYTNVMAEIHGFISGIKVARISNSSN